MVCHVHRAVRSDAVDLAGAPRSVALGQVGLTDGRAFALQDNHVCSMQTWLACGRIGKRWQRWSRVCAERHGHEQLEAVEVDAQAAHPLSPRSGLGGGTGSLGDLDVLRYCGGGLLLASTGVERDGEAQQHHYQQQDEHDALEQVLELVIHNCTIIKWLHFGILFLGIKAGARFGGELSMAVDRGTREALPQFTDQRQQRCLLGGGAGVLGLALAVKPADIADADGMGIVALAVGTGFLEGAALVDRPVEVNNVVVADVRELALQMPLADLLDGNLLPFPRCGAVDNDLIDASHGGQTLAAETGVSTPAS